MSPFADYSPQQLWKTVIRLISIPEFSNTRSFSFRSRSANLNKMSTSNFVNPFANCTGPITPECPAYWSYLGYQPDLVPNAVFFGIHVVCAIVQLILGIRYKTWTYMIALFCGCVLELLGYLGRMKMHADPWDGGAYKLQITTLIIAPAFTAAGIYLTLKHVVLTFGREYSILKPALYTWIFVCADIATLLVQAAGAALFSGTNVPYSTLKAGADIAVAGIAAQVGFLSFFGICAVIYLIRLNRNWRNVSLESVQIAQSTRTHFFAAAVIVAYIAVLIRCIYRIPELAGGYRNAVYLNQTDFIVLDGVMIAVATILLTVFHPGIFFPQLSAPVQKKRKEKPSGEPYIELEH